MKYLRLLQRKYEKLLQYAKKKRKRENYRFSHREEAAQEILLIEEMGSDADAVDEVLDEMEEHLNIAMACRRGIPGDVPKSNTWRNCVLPTMDEGRFKEMLRVPRDQFSVLVNLIKEDEEFNNAHSSKQFSIELQLAIVLFRLGSSGESATFRKIGTIFGIGDGGTIMKITKRIFKVFLKLQSRFIQWPNETERSKIVSESFNELPFCIGYIDGTEIKLAEAPIIDHTSYFSRNHIYSLIAQIVCDHKLKIRHVVVGHQGSWHDARIYRNSSLFIRKRDYFSSQQWIAGDSAYPLSDILITPYRSNAKQLDRNARITFNKQHSKYRVRVEHCFGILKERFGSLKQLRMRLADKESHRQCCDWFLVCCILHNILIENKHDNYNEYNLNIDQSNEVASIDAEDATANGVGEIKRQAIYALIAK